LKKNVLKEKHSQKPACFALLQIGEIWIYLDHNMKYKANNAVVKGSDLKADL
jgi:hypothetical protein